MSLSIAATPAPTYDLGQCHPENYTHIMPQTGWCTISKPNFFTIYEICSSLTTSIDDPVTSDVGSCSPIPDGANCITKLRSFYCSISCLECEANKTQSPLRVCYNTCDSVRTACPQMYANPECSDLFSKMSIFCAGNGVTPCTDVASGNGPAPTPYPTPSPTPKDKGNYSMSNFNPSAYLLIVYSFLAILLIV